MNVIELNIKGVFLVQPYIFEDSRGYFYESYNHKRFCAATGFEGEFVQDNHSQSSFGVIRGLHFQKNPRAQSKLVRVLEGKILDVAVDLRKGSETFGEHVALELSADNKHQLFIPKGFAHGFSVLSERAQVLYKCDEYYAPETEGGIIYNDPDLNIDWKVPVHLSSMSDKDQVYPTLKTCQVDF